MAADLDIENRDELQRYLRANFAPAEEFEICEFRILAGGVSSRTVLVEFAGGQRWVLKQALAKLRVAADWFSDPVRVHREALGMRVLHEILPQSIPKLIFDDERHHVLGMEAVSEPHENWKTMLLAGRGLEFAEWFGIRLLVIHCGSYNRSADDALARRFDDRTFFETLRLEPYYEYSASQAPSTRPFFDELIAETRSRRLTLVHGDYSPKNVLISPGGGFFLLDHEVIHWGDPAFDVGFALTHLLSKAHHLPGSRSRFQEASREFWTAYSGGFGDFPGHFILNEMIPLEGRAVRHALGCLLARVIGRSPLEYLTADERLRQKDAVLRLMSDVPRGIPELIDRFVQEMDR